MRTDLAVVLAFVSALSLVPAPHAQAQNGTGSGGAPGANGDSQPASGVVKQKKKTKRELEEEEEKRHRSPWFPSWGRPGWDWHFNPIVAYQMASETTPAGTEETNTEEIGLHAGLTEIPLVPGNPGVGLGVGGVAAWGLTSNLTTANGTESATIPYRREVGTVGLTGYYGWVREELDLLRGRLEYLDQEHTMVQSAHVKLDNGLLVLSWFSAHYTYEYLRAFTDQYDDPFLVQQDHWIHGRFTTDILNFFVDLGPGVTYATVYQPVPTGGTQEGANGTTDYVKALTGLHLFWKLGATAQAKYVFDSTANATGAYAGTRLPEEELSQPSELAEPADSVQNHFLSAPTT